ncbi:hypothetical protein CEK28_08660 [Xenophilus sp. AP218F]|nr:hypothetical protein CEK28_08660 [Xenophilus sp. AP218F]
MTMAHFLDLLQQALPVVTSVISAASAVAAITPNKKDDKVVGTLRRVADVLALNVGHAKK